MSRTAEKLDGLIAEDASIGDALETIRQEIDENGGAVDWADVRGEISSGQWGRLIETGVLVDSEDGFTFAEPEAVDTVLDGDGETTSGETPEGTEWSGLDKMAAAGAVVMMIGYRVGPVRETVGTTLDVVLEPLEATLPFYAVILSVALITGLYSTLLQANLSNPEVMAMYQEKMQAVQDERKAIKERKKEAEERGASEAELDRIDQEMDEIQEKQMEAFAENLGMFKEQLRPMVWIMLLTIPLFLWMYWRIQDGGVGSEMMVMPLLGAVEWNSGFLGPMPVWILWYFLCSLGFTQLIRKALDIDMTPSG
ncbi:MAG: DUF106 domain-containing protein [Natrialbaceae archaeon]|nr:DUF106 domain-containing protein [Natrialbaceae archaeon]